jgi:hypothetical protein
MDHRLCPPFQQIDSLQSKATHLLLRHKDIDFRQVVFHNIVIVRFHTQGVQVDRKEAASSRTAHVMETWGREPFNFPIHKTQGSLLTRCDVND